MKSMARLALTVPMEHGAARGMEVEEVGSRAVLQNR